MFTTQHYGEIAGAIRQLEAEQGDSVGIGDVASAFVALFEGDNERFDRKLFYEALGWNEDGEPADNVVIGGVYRRAEHEGVAWRVVGFPEVQPECPGHPASDEPNDGHAGIGDVVYCDGSCQFPETDESRVVAVMVGDNRQHVFDADELTALEDNEFCSECGQIGCGHGRVEV